MAVGRNVMRDVDRGDLLQARKGDVRRELAGLRSKADLAQEALLLPLQLVQLAIAGGAGEDRPGLRAPEAVEPVDSDIDRSALASLAENRRDILGHALVDVADEAQGDVVVLGLDPACAGKPAAK